MIDSFDKNDEIKNMIKKYHKELINNETFIFEKIKKEFENIRKFFLIYTNFYYLEVDYIERLNQILNLMNVTIKESEINIESNKEFSYNNILRIFKNTLIKILNSHNKILEEIEKNLLNDKKVKMFKNFENIENEYSTNKFSYQTLLRNKEIEINTLEKEYINEAKNNISNIFKYLQKNYKKNNEKTIFNLESLKNNICKEKEEKYIKNIFEYNKNYNNYYKENYKFFFKLIKYQFDTFNDLFETIQIFNKIYSKENNNINKYYENFFNFSKQFNIENEIKNIIILYKDYQNKKSSFNNNNNNSNNSINNNNNNIEDNFENIELENDNNNDNNGLKKKITFNSYITKYEYDQSLNDIKKKYNKFIAEKTKDLIESFYQNSNKINEKIDILEQDNEKYLEDEINMNIYKNYIPIFENLIKGKLNKNLYEKFKEEINLSLSKTKFFLNYLNKNRSKLIVINENGFDLIVDLFDNILNKNKNYPDLIEFIIILSQTFTKEIKNTNNEINNENNEIKKKKIIQKF